MTDFPQNPGVFDVGKPRPLAAKSAPSPASIPLRVKTSPVVPRSPRKGVSRPTTGNWSFEDKPTDARLLAKIQTARGPKGPCASAPLLAGVRMAVFDALPEGSGVLVSGLSMATCRWPCGDETDLEVFRYCGLTVAHGSYCVDHGALAYCKPKVKAEKLRSW